MSIASTRCDYVTLNGPDWIEFWRNVFGFLLACYAAMAAISTGRSFIAATAIIWAGPLSCSFEHYKIGRRKMADPFMGQIMQVGFNFAPRGWQICAGQLISISQNSAMFALLGTTFGGDGQVTFGLPDARGRLFVGVGQGPGLSNYVWGERIGTEQNTLLTANMPAHNHTAVFQGIQGATTASGTLSALTTVASADASNAAGTGSQLSNAFPGTGGGTVKIYAPAGSGSTAVNLGGLTVTGGNFTPQGNITVGVTGNNIPVNNIQPLLAVYTIIAMEGIFPSRP